MRWAKWALAGAVVLAAAVAGGCGGRLGMASREVTVGPNRALMVNGKAFFPLLGFYQSVKNFDNARAMGLNGYFMPGKTDGKEYLAELAARDLYGVVPFDASLIGNKSLLAWVLPHEPDVLKDGAPRTPPAEVEKMYSDIKSQDGSRPVVLDFSPQFMLRAEFAQGGLTEEQKRELYGEYAKSADILTYNVYPIWNYNKPENIWWVAEAARDLKDLTGGKKPFWAMIETGKGGRGVAVEEQQDVTPEQIKAEVWLAITQGATGIIYFTHQFKPTFTEFGLSDEKQAAIMNINSQIQQMTPVLMDKPSTRSVSVVVQDLATLETPPEKMMSFTTREHDGYLYIFVANAWSERAGYFVTVNVAGIKRGTKVEQVDPTPKYMAPRLPPTFYANPDPKKAIEANDGFFVAGSGPFVVHIYRIKMRGAFQ